MAQGTAPTQLTLTCHVTGSVDGKSRDFNYSIDSDKSTVNDFPAMITEGEIVWEDVRGGTVFRSTINRYTGRIASGSKQFPLLGSGDCTKNPQRAF